jgi:hypothetical protein
MVFMADIKKRAKTAQTRPSIFLLYFAVAQCVEIAQRGCEKDFSRVTECSMICIGAAALSPFIALSTLLSINLSVRFLLWSLARSAQQFMKNKTENDTI